LVSVRSAAPTANEVLISRRQPPSFKLIVLTLGRMEV
jgi:hypothetical protein